MFDDLYSNDASAAITSHESAQLVPNTTYQSSGPSVSNDGGNGYQAKGGYDKGKFFKKKEEVIEPAYIAVAIYIDREFPLEVKNHLVTLAGKFIEKEVHVRINADDKELCGRLTKLSDVFVELYSPWKGFNEIDSKLYYNTLTSKHIAAKHFFGWEKVPDVVKAILARAVRMVFGNKNDSGCLCVITWSKDGASKATEVNKDTGKASFIIKMASSYGFPIINIGKQTAGSILEKTFGII